MIDKLDQRMNDTLPVDENVHLVLGHIKQPNGFDHFESLVDQRRAVNRNALAHAPVRMLQRLFGRNSLQLLTRIAKKRAAGAGDDQTVHRLFVIAVQGFMNGTVFTVHRQDVYTLFTRKRHDKLTGRHKRFLVGDGNVLAAFNGLKRRQHAGKTDDGVE